MIGRPVIPLLALFVVFAAAHAPRHGTEPGPAASDTVATLLRQRLADPSTAGLLSPELVARFYARRAYAPAWSATDGARPEAADLVRAIRAAETDGLRPESYRETRIEAALRRMQPPVRVPEPADRATLDLLLSDAFLTYGRHLLHGRVDPRRIHPGWSISGRAADPISLLEDAVRDGRLDRALAALVPRDPAYVALRRMLGHYRAIEAAGGWPTLPAGPAIRPGDRGESVGGLRARLAVERTLPPADSAGSYDAALEAAVRDVQRRYGLLEDAIVGPATRAALNVPARARREQIELGMERLRWLPADLGPRHVRVSIPAFELALVDHGRSTIAMRIVGGRPDWPTPIFSARMTSVVLSPYWNIPASIAAREVVPAQRRDPHYLDRNRIRVVTGYGTAERVVGASSIDWSRFDPRRSPYRLRQDPGPGNALGGVKFVFPNPYNTYLHDTPSRSLFAAPSRAFSHGCMRIEKPVELAELVLADLGWDRPAILAAIARAEERTVALDKPIPVHVLYQTAWVDDAGQIQFRDDLYGHDRRLAGALAGDAAVASERISPECTADAQPENGTGQRRPEIGHG